MCQEKDAEVRASREKAKRKPKDQMQCEGGRYRGWGKMGADDSLRRPLEGVAKR